MCGICGFTHDGEEYGAVVERLTVVNDAIRHRGPDDDGTFVDASVALGMRRLAIIDLAGGKQPIANEDGHLVILYNGETYNYRELRQDLIARGHVFSTNCDTEVVLHLYEEYGADCVSHMNGMFAFVIYDKHAKKLFLARDRLGIKPLYYAQNGKQFLFGSELKSLVPLLDAKPEIDMNALGEYLRYLYITGDHCIYKGVRKLRAGHSLTVDVATGTIETTEYWRPTFDPVEKAEPEWREELQHLLTDSVKLRMISDVPLGCFLSGGVDSSCVTALAAKAANHKLQTFSIGFDTESENELPYARDVASHCDTDHSEFIVQADAIQHLPSLVKSFDEPFADPSAVPTYILCRNTRKHVTVALSGDGGDELFGGYQWMKSQYFQNRRFGWMPKTGTIGDWDRNQSVMARVGRYMNDVLSTPHDAFLRKQSCFTDAMLQRLMTSEIYDQLNSGDDELAARLQECDGDFNNAMLYQSLRTYLVDDILTKVDRMSMAVSLEVRVPLLDHRIVELAGRIPFDMKIRPDGTTKHILKSTMEHALPAGIFSQRKHGFSIPVHEWFRNELYSFAHDLLTSRSFADSGYFSKRYIEDMLSDHKRGRRDSGYQLWSLVCFQLWREEVYAA